MHQCLQVSLKWSKQLDFLRTATSMLKGRIGSYQYRWTPQYAERENRLTALPLASILFEDMALMGFVYFVFTCLQGGSYRTCFRSVLLCPL